MNDKLVWKFLDKYFQDNPTALVNHHLESYNDFYSNGINQLFKEKNPIRIVKDLDSKTKEYNLQAELFLGGKLGDKIYYGKPIIFDQQREHYMYPNEARLRNMTYAMTIHYDVEVDFIINGERSREPILLDRIFLGRFPIMLMSKPCILNGLSRHVRHAAGECKNDNGGYFIIDGKEKTVISQEKFANNMIYITDKVNDLYSHAANVRCVSEDTSKPVRTLSIRIVTPSTKYANNNIVVNIPNVRKPIPLFILMRALGIISDKSIIESCLLDMDKYQGYIDLFIPSIYDAGKIFTQDVAIKYIGTFTKGKTVPHVMDILCNYLLPQIGELNFRDKACYIGYMVFELLKVYKKKNKPTNRDSFKYKRIEVPGILIADLFKEYYTLQLRNIYLRIDKEYNFHQGRYINNFPDLIKSNYIEFFQDRVVESGFKKAFKGNWGAEPHTKRVGVVQDLNRLSFNSALSLMRKINLPLDSSAKVIGPRLLHGSQWGIIDPLDTPDGGNIGLHKHLSIMAKITKHCSRKGIIEWLRKNTTMVILNECSFKLLGSLTKIFVNHAWIGCDSDPELLHEKFINSRRNGLIYVYTSINWDIQNHAVYIYTDAGRLCYPVYYIDKMTNAPSVLNENIIDIVKTGDYKWNELICGFNKKNKEFNISSCKTYIDVEDLYTTTNLQELLPLQGVIEYVDTSEKEGTLIAIELSDLKQKKYSHMEIHPSFLFGVMGNQIIYPENNPLPRDLFSCGQSKQAVSIYHSNFLSRIDKSSLILNYGQIPLVKSRYMKYINNEEHPYGENVIVAIACYSSYNVEDSILFNQASVDRGLFRTTYYNMYENREESSTIGGTTIDSRFANIYKEKAVGIKPGYDYSELNDFGIINENTKIDDKHVIIGKISTNLAEPDIVRDASTFPKKGQFGYIDKSFITENEEGFRLAKVRVREERIPSIGDKFCSRCGQKGTIGRVISEDDMPFTSDGMRPDIIINPHALPSRMTIGQLLETVIGKSCSLYGAFGDCTAFINKGSKYDIFGKLLSKQGFHTSGNEILYNGETGEQLAMPIFTGPTYYMRLKHMVKDKINFRAQGPRTLLSRQPVQGRANDGGLRIGELERDAIIAHGLSYFLKESLMVRGDEYKMAICNLTGFISIYNVNLDLFVSPFADGPVKYAGALENNFNIEKLTKYGRNFSIINIPYAFKLLMQELATLNVQMRIITEDNVDQLHNMQFSEVVNDLQNRPVSSDATISETPDVVSSILPEEGSTPEQTPVLSTLPAELAVPTLAAEPSAEKPSAEEPSAEEPSAEEPSAEKPSAEKLSAEEPSAEKPSAEELEPLKEVTDDEISNLASNEETIHLIPSSNEQRVTTKLVDDDSTNIDNVAPMLTTIEESKAPDEKEPDAQEKTVEINK